MAIQVFTVDEGIQVDNGSGTTVWDVDNTGAMTVAATSRLTGIVTMGTAEIHMLSLQSMEERIKS